MLGFSSVHFGGGCDQRASLGMAKVEQYGPHTHETAQGAAGEGEDLNRTDVTKIIPKASYDAPPLEEGLDRGPRGCGGVRSRNPTGGQYTV